MLTCKNRCDTIGLDGKMAEGLRSTFAHAQKMRASMTYVFGRIYGAGRSAWQVSFSERGETTTSGNPSLSDKVSTYMLSLRRRKVLASIDAVIIFPIEFKFRYRVAKRLPARVQLHQ